MKSIYCVFFLVTELIPAGSRGKPSGNTFDSWLNSRVLVTVMIPAVAGLASLFSYRPVGLLYRQCFLVLSLTSHLSCNLSPARLWNKKAMQRSIYAIKIVFNTGNRRHFGKCCSSIERPFDFFQRISHVEESALKIPFLGCGGYESYVFWSRVGDDLESHLQFSDRFIGKSRERWFL